MRKPRRDIANGVGYGLSLAVLGAVAATAIGASAAITVRRHRDPPFTLVVAQRDLSIQEGATARYTIWIHRRSFHGRVAIGVTGLPAYANSRVRYRGSDHTRAVVRVATSYLLTPVGIYHLRLRGTGERFAATVRLTLRVQQPRLVPVGISGSVGGLQPGSPQPLNLSLHNPYRAVVLVIGISVRILSLNAPRASPTLPCTLGDFSVQQYSGSYPLVVPQHASRTLSSLGVATAADPLVQLLEWPINQDGCQGATLTLGYAARAVVL